MEHPTTVIAGITVPFTQLIQTAIEHVKKESPPSLFHHVMRSWLFAAKLAEDNLEVDKEALALAVVLHDLGLVSRYETPERRFEVDGAVAAMSFLSTHEGTSAPGSAEYYKHNLRKVQVWHAVALHTTSSIAQHAPPEISIAHRGIAIDFAGIGLEDLPDMRETVGRVLEAFPRLDAKDDIRNSLCALARDKPETTYDNFVAAFGEAYVKGYKTSTVALEELVARQASNPLDNWCAD